MTSQYEMQFPFTTQQEILDWEARYIARQSEERQRQEQDVIDIKENVTSRETSNTPGGYLRQTELRKMGDWIRSALTYHIDNNPPGRVKEITKEAFSLDDDWEKLEKLTGIDGVREPVASGILHLYDRKKYPFLSHHALRSIGIRTNNYDEPLWREYVAHCRAKATCYDVSMRTLDRALREYSRSGTATSHSR